MEGKQASENLVRLNDVSALVSSPFPCPNCGAPNTLTKLFCSDLCKDEAKFVRYFRACADDGRIDQPDVEEAIKIRMAFILAGGYDRATRQVSEQIRQAVFARDEGCCRLCGKPGKEIDHISGASSDLENLQLLCNDCHNQKTVSTFVKISPETHPEEWAKREQLLARSHAPDPVQLCDSTEWQTIWRTVLAQKKKAVALEPGS